MAGNFDLPPWLTTQAPWSGSDAFIKGSQAGSAIAANRLRAKQLYVEVQQNQHRMDLAERQFITENEASTLKNEVIRTKLANDAADFQTLREWWPQFQSSEGEIDMPVLRDENTMLKVAAAVAEKRSKIGQAAFAELMATPGFDLADPEDQKKYFELLSRYKNIPAKLGPDGVMGPIKVAEGLKRLRDEADSRIAARVDRTDFNNKKLALQQLLADHTIPLTDARVVQAQQEAALAERELIVKERNVGLRERDVTNKEKRTAERGWTPEDRIEYNKRTKVIDDNVKLSDDEKDLAIQEIREDIDGKRQQRETFKAAKTAREGLKTNEPPVVSPQPRGITKEEYDKLAPGTKYIAPDGTERTKG